MEAVKHKVLCFWLSHMFLRRIGKRYPDFFVSWIADLTDNRRVQKVMALRYTGKNQMKFEAIALTMNISLRAVFDYHKKGLDAVIHG